MAVTNPYSRGGAQVPDRDDSIKADLEDPTPEAEIRTREFDRNGREVSFTSVLPASREREILSMTAIRNQLDQAKEDADRGSAASADGHRLTDGVVRGRCACSRQNARLWTHPRARERPRGLCRESRSEGADVAWDGSHAPLSSLVLLLPARNGAPVSRACKCGKNASSTPQLLHRFPHRMRWDNAAHATRELYVFSSTHARAISLTRVTDASSPCFRSRSKSRLKRPFA